MALFWLVFTLRPGSNVEVFKQLKDNNITNINLCLDKDKAGREGTLKAIEKIRDVAPETNINQVNLPDSYKDIDEMLADGKGKELQTAINNAESIPSDKTVADIRQDMRMQEVGVKTDYNELVEEYLILVAKEDKQKELQFEISKKLTSNEMETNRIQAMKDKVLEDKDALIKHMPLVTKNTKQLIDYIEKEDWNSLKTELDNDISLVGMKTILGKNEKRKKAEELLQMSKRRADIIIREEQLINDKKNTIAKNQGSIVKEQKELKNNKLTDYEVQHKKILEKTLYDNFISLNQQQQKSLKNAGIQIKTKDLSGVGME